MSADVHDKDDMAEEYDFSEAKQGPILASRPHATTIWLRVDNDLLDWNRAQVHAQGGATTARSCTRPCGSTGSMPRAFKPAGKEPELGNRGRATGEEWRWQHMRFCKVE
jgi:hypothetical protein